MNKVAWAGLIRWLRDLFTARAQNVSLRQQLETAQADNERYSEEIAEARAIGEMQAQKYQHAVESLARLTSERVEAEARALTSQQALERTIADLDAARRYIEALRASQAALRASDAAHEGAVLALREKVARLDDQNADLNERYRAYVLPLLPETTTVSRPLEWVADILTPLIREVVPGVKNSPVWLDGTYYLVPVETYQPIMDHWRKYLMMPYVPDASDCDNRAIDFNAWAHRWSKGLFAPGMTIGTTPWALKDGQPYPHFFCVVVDPDGKVWALDPALNPAPVPWSDEITMWTPIY